MACDCSFLTLVVTSIRWHSSIRETQQLTRDEIETGLATKRSNLRHDEMDDILFIAHAPNILP